MNYEIFLSYSRKDNVAQKPGNTCGWVTVLRDEILARHYKVTGAPLRSHPFYDADSIKGMEDWRHRILVGLQQSKILVVCLSPNYFNSDNCLWEWEEFHRHKASRLVGHESVAPVYFIEAPGSDEQVNAAFAAFVQRGHYQEGELAKFIPRWKEWHAAVRRFNHYDFRPWFPQGSEALAEEAVRRCLDELAGNLTDRLARTRRAADAPGNLREYNPHFVGREKQLIQLHETLIKDGAVGLITAVNGFGGQGKTEFAVTYAHSRADSYPGGLWVLGAEGRAELLPLLGELAGDARLGIPPSAGPDETAAQRGLRVLERMKALALAAQGRDPDGGAATLLILDNVSEPGLLSKTERATLNLPALGWLRLVATTRLGPDAFPLGHGPIQFHEIASLEEDDAVDLIRNHQPPLDADGLTRDFPPATAAADAAAAREIARELGGFTLAVESVAIYLGLHPEIRPADYLARLRKEGLPSVDDLVRETDPLTGEAKVAAEMLHREKQLRLVLDQTLARLTPAERTALEYAALLPPDSIPWPWLRAMVEREHPDSIPSAPGHPDPWPALRRRLEGLRLLTPGDHVNVARLHRMVAAHLVERLSERETAAGAGMARPSKAELLRRLRDKVEDFALALQDDILHDPAAHVWQVAPLQDAVRHWRDGGQDIALSHIAGVVGAIEATLGRLDVAEIFLRIAKETLERLLADNPTSAQVAREVSVSLNMLGDFLATRGQPGDAEAALRHFQRALEISERLLADNPTSAQAARDVSVCLIKLGDFFATRGQPGDTEAALRDFQRSLEVAERLVANNPTSAQSARDVSVSLNRLGDYLASRGQPGDTEAALRHFLRCLELAERLLAGNPTSAQSARDVSVSLIKLGDYLSTRGQPGDAKAALRHFLRCHEVLGRLLAENPASAQASTDYAISNERLADFNLALGQAEEVLKHYETAREIWNKFHAANPESAAFARGLSVVLHKLGDFFATRGQPGDAEAALRHFQRSLEVAERLMADNPTSALAARDGSVSLSKLGDFLAKRGQPGDAYAALRHFKRCHDVLERLLTDNPTSAQAARDVSVSHFKFFHFHQQRGDENAAVASLTQCFAILDSFAREGRPMDAQMRQLHAQLAPLFSKR